MLAGEYAVLQPHGICVAVAVGEVVRARVTDGDPGVTLHAFGKTFDLQSDPANGLIGFVTRALQWLKKQHHLELNRHLQLDVQGAVGDAKVGLGTSAAVTVATIKAVLGLNALEWTAAEIAAAAREIHAAGQGAGSGYDVTTIAYGGCVRYERSPDRAVRLEWPKDLYGAALFSGQPAPTQAAVEKHPLPPAVLAEIDAAARALVAAWDSDAPAILAALATCDSAFLAAAALDPSLIPASVGVLREFISASGCIPRASGAGGGDCVLAFGEQDRIASLCAGWEKRGGAVIARFPADIAKETP